MFEGSHDWAREDELDLNQEEDEERQHDNPGQDGKGTGQGRGDGSMAHVEEDLSLVLNGHDHEQTSTVAAAGMEDDAPPLHPPSLPQEPLGSVDETASTPDDTPSIQVAHTSLFLFDSLLTVQGSFRSSPSSNLLPLRASPTPSHRPFDLRFQSRLSSPASPFGSQTSSPYLGYIHSRHSSLAGQFSPGTVDSDSENPQGPWDVVRWTRLRKITGQAFSEVGKRNFGHPTCMAVTTSIVIGTSRGIVLVFDYQQSLKAIIGPGTKGILDPISPFTCTN